MEYQLTGIPPINWSLSAVKFRAFAGTSPLCDDGLDRWLRQGLALFDFLCFPTVEFAGPLIQKTFYRCLTILVLPRHACALADLVADVGFLTGFE